MILCMFATDLSTPFLDKKQISSKQRESDSEEEQPKAKAVCSPPSSSQRVPVFPSLNPAGLLVCAQGQLE